MGMPRMGMALMRMLVVGVAFVSLIVRTPLRWVLGGPVRAEQRVRDNAEVALRAVPEAEFATA